MLQTTVVVCSIAAISKPLGYAHLEIDLPFGLSPADGSLSGSLLLVLAASLATFVAFAHRDYKRQYPDVVPVSGDRYTIDVSRMPPFEELPRPLQVNFTMVRKHLLCTLEVLDQSSFDSERIEQITARFIEAYGYSYVLGENHRAAFGESKFDLLEGWDERPITHNLPYELRRAAFELSSALADFSPAAAETRPHVSRDDILSHLLQRLCNDLRDFEEALKYRTRFWATFKQLRAERKGVANMIDFWGVIVLAAAGGIALLIDVL